MYLLNSSESIQVVGAISSLGKPIGCVSGALLATPFSLGSILFGANGTAQGRELSNLMVGLGEATTSAGCYLGSTLQASKN